MVLVESSYCKKIGGSVEPITKENAESEGQYVYQEGKTVFKHAVKNMADVAEANHD